MNVAFDPGGTKKVEPEAYYNQLINLIIREQLRSFACIGTNGLQLKLQVPNLSASFSEVGVQLAIFVTESGNLLWWESVNAPRAG